jgi:hypothetical protein
LLPLTCLLQRQNTPDESVPSPFHLPGVAVEIIGT